MPENLSFTLNLDQQENYEFRGIPVHVRVLDREGVAVHEAGAAEEAPDAA